MARIIRNNKGTLNVPKISECVEAFILSRRTQNCSFQTIKFYKKKLPQIVTWFEDEGITEFEDISPTDIRVYLNQQGDIAIVLQTQTVDWSGQIYIVRINGDDVTVKKVVENSNGLELIPMNPKYGSMKYTKDQVRDLPIEILGRVVEIRRNLNKNKRNGKRL